MRTLRFEQWGEQNAAKLLPYVPLRAFSKAVRGLSEVQVPASLRPGLWKALASQMGIDLAEAELPTQEYRSFAELFVRRLRPGSRHIDTTRQIVTSPVDGCVSHAGIADGTELIQAKGIKYSLLALLGDSELADALVGGPYITLYLRPKDYHRIHAPIAGDLCSVRHVPGSLFPVQPWVVRQVPGLFAKNERVICEFNTAIGKMALICVGASGVGTITTVFGMQQRGKKSFATPLPFDKGDELAAFRLGSTVILVFEPGRLQWATHGTHDEVRVGSKLAMISNTHPAGVA